MLENCPYEANDYLAESPQNLTIWELRKFDEDRFRVWATAFRMEVIYAWDNLGIPVIGGVSADDIVGQFQKLAVLDVHDLSAMDELTGKTDCILNNSNVGSACNQFFPTLLKTRDVSAPKQVGVSVYDMFAQSSLLDKFISRMRKLITCDPMKYFSKVLERKDAQNPIAWLEENGKNGNYGFWLGPKMGGGKHVEITTDQLEYLKKECHDCEDEVYGEGPWSIYYFSREIRLLDVVGMLRHIIGSTPPTNFKPSTAKHLYLRFTEHIPKSEQVIIYDPSAGWGGRILAAMACGNERPIHYVGTDPNPDHWMPEIQTSKYAYLADYFHGNVRTKHRNTYELFDLGSEEIAYAERFQRYKGQVDFIFTSPPYFGVEAYSEDDRQSSVKYPNYDAWRDDFLRPTLTTCVEWLKENRFICINIADVHYGDEVLPLQSDVVEILSSLGMAQHPALKMVLVESPLGHRENERGVSVSRNFCKVRGKRRKYEPILVFQKLIGHNLIFGDEYVTPEIIENLYKSQKIS